jgi:tagaturonate reductase
MDRILQFGTGRFLRGFVEAFIDDADKARQAAQRPGGTRVTVVETSGSGMAARLAAQGYQYTLHTRGWERGARVDTSRSISVIDEGVDATVQTDDLLEAALDPRVRTIVSNTTERGYAPERLPRLLALVLMTRSRAGLPLPAVVPCELVERNGDRLRALVGDALVASGAEASEASTILHETVWATTIVDRIVTVPSDPSEIGGGLDVVAEPYASWIIETKRDVPLIEHPSVMRTADATPYALRKIRLLNGAHTALVARTRGGPHRLVREALDDPDVGQWVEALLLEEIVPALGERIVNGEAYVRSVLERLRNPFIDHRLADIAVDHEQKVRSRLQPTFDDFVARFGRRPARLTDVLRREGLLT